VPVDPRNYRNYRRGDIIVSLAGIATNLVLAIILTLLIIPLGLLGRAVPGIGTSLALLQIMFLYGIVINLLLAGFNLIPIPPLDGSHVLKHLLPPKMAWHYQRFGKYGILILVALLWLGNGATFTWLMQPVTFAQGVAFGVVRPFVLASPWTT
jgi:Zn-dependent protease